MLAAVLYGQHLLYFIIFYYCCFITHHYYYYQTNQTNNRTYLAALVLPDYYPKALFPDHLRKPLIVERRL